MLEEKGKKKQSNVSFWVHLWKLHDGLICIAFHPSVQLSVCLSVTKIRLDNNAYLVKILWNIAVRRTKLGWKITLKCTVQCKTAYIKENVNNHPLYLFVYMHVICENRKVGSMSTSSCIFFSLGPFSARQGNCGPKNI